MSRNVDIELARYRDISRYQPKVGDTIIKHGWLQRTLWFGVINYIDNNGMIQIIKSGLPRLLFTMGGTDVLKNTITISPSDITGSMAGSYSAMQQEGNVMVWYV